jgi:hypothetical protein
MTDVFDRILEQKKAAIAKVVEGLQDLRGQPVLWPPDEELRKCSSPEIVYLISLQAQADLLNEMAATVVTTIYNRNSRIQTTGETLKQLGKLDAPKGGTSFGW